MGRVNDLYMDELERRADELIEQGMSGSDAYDRAAQEAYDGLGEAMASQLDAEFARIGDAHE